MTGFILCPAEIFHGNIVIVPLIKKGASAAPFLSGNIRYTNLNNPSEVYCAMYASACGSLFLLSVSPFPG